MQIQHVQPRMAHAGRPMPQAKPTQLAKARFGAKNNKKENRMGFWEFLNNNLLWIFLLGGGVIAAGVKGCNQALDNLTKQQPPAVQAPENPGK